MNNGRSRSAKASPKALAQRAHGLGLAAALLMLAACSGAPVPPVVWLRLPPGPVQAPAIATPPPATPPATLAPAMPAPAATREVWQLMLPLQMPAHLERDSLFVPQAAGGAAGAWVRPLAGARWVEPLRDAVPRLLREDLVRATGGRALWTAPLPPGLVPTRQLRVEITAFEAGNDGRALVTQARWSLADVRGATPPAVHEARLDTAPASAADPEAWAMAHRQAIAALAARIATTMAAP